MRRFLYVKIPDNAQVSIGKLLFSQRQIVMYGSAVSILSSFIDGLNLVRHTDIFSLFRAI